MSIAIMAGLLEARGHRVTVIDPVEKLLAVGHYLESTVDIAESTRRIAASQIPADHMILMAGFTAGNEKVNWWCWGVMALTTLPPCWPPVYALTAVKSGLTSMVCIPVTRASAGRQAAEIDVLPGSDGTLLLRRQSPSPSHHYAHRPVPDPCLIKNTGNPQAPGTLIGASSDDDNLPVKGSLTLTTWRCLASPARE